MYIHVYIHSIFRHTAKANDLWPTYVCPGAHDRPAVLACTYEMSTVHLDFCITTDSLFSHQLALASIGQLPPKIAVVICQQAKTFG